MTSTAPGTSTRGAAGVEVLDRAELFRRMPWEGPSAPDWAPLVDREWLLTNGLGGYASGSVSGAQTRRYHGWLIGAFPPPTGRIMLLADLEERIRLPSGTQIRLGGEERKDLLELHGARHLVEFRLEAGLPVWTYAFEGVRIERRLVLPNQTNVACLTWRVVEGDGEIELAVAPLLHFRSHDAPVDHLLDVGQYRAQMADGVLRVRGPDEYPGVRLRICAEGCSYREEQRVVQGLLYKVEASRGYSSVGDRWSPGWFTCRFAQGRPAGLAVGPDEGTDPPDPLDDGITEAEMSRRIGLIERAGRWARRAPAAELVLAADQFVIRPPREKRVEGEAPRTVIAGYHWFTDWGRDTMISLEGLTLTTGRWDEARLILLTFGRHARDGLIPNLFPEGQSQGLYHTADATLWFFHAVERYTAITGDRSVLEELLPTFREIVRKHVEGTHFGIGVDPKDDLLRQGAEGYQLTWMDAKVGDWVVTPRRGKAVEINALWYNALRLLARWEADAGNAAAAAELGARADRTCESFNRRFWIAEQGYLYDVIDGESGNDPAFRPNQVFSISLPYAVLDRGRWGPVMEAVRQKLLTPVGLRSLAPGDPDYKSVYFGDLRTRDAAYHQGTVWGWLIGPFVDAWLRVHPDDRTGARRFLSGLVDHLGDGCIGTLAEVFDAEPPFTPRGCVAQAWSVAEALRCWRMAGEG
jgi:predicted glycogen debranching enzyme